MRRGTKSSYLKASVVASLIPGVCVVFILSSSAGRSLLTKGENAMTTKETIQGYFAALKEQKKWESFLSDDVVFASYKNPIRTVTGKNAFLEATNRFYSSIVSVEVKDMLCDKERACALTHYVLRAPGGNSFTSDVAEIFTVEDSRISSFAIYFDSAPFPK